MITRYRLSSQLKFNIKSYLDRDLVNDGLYINVASGDFDVSGERADIFKRVNGFHYESAFDNFVYETDASGVSSHPAFVASGVYVNGVFNPKGGGTYKPSIDYRNGRVFFESAVPANSTVSAEFSYKHTRVDFPDSRRVNLIFSAIKDSVDFTENVFPSGFDRQLPVVVIDIQRRLSSPFALGGGKTHDTLIALHVISNSTHELDQIVDFLTERSFQKTIRGVDFNKIPELFTEKGDIASTYENYSNLQGDLAFEFPKIYINRASLISTGEIRGVRIARVHWNAVIYSNLPV